MKKSNHKAIAIVGLGAIMPDAGDAKTFWQNIKQSKYSISEVRPDRWDIKKYFDPDPKAPDRSYTKIGGWVHDFDWQPLKWKMPIPPKVGDQMDYTQKWAIMGAREALMDFGFPERKLNHERTAVIFGNAMSGDLHLYSAARILFPEIEEQLVNAKTFTGLSAEQRKNILEELRTNVGNRYAPITEDTMPGELSNIVAGRIAALYDFKGPNYIADAACASAMAAMSAAIEGLEQGDYDTVLTGGIDANMSASSYIKFCKIGALSATGTRPYDQGADGFVMGEGAAVFLLKRLADAEKDGDKIYAVIRGIGGSSDGKGKGITAPNPAGQKFAIERGWENAGVSPSTAGMIEGHGTSTRVGDAGELTALNMVFDPLNLKPGSIALGSVKSNIGHLKAAAGSAGVFKMAMALHDKVLPPSLNFQKPNLTIDFNKTPFAVNTQLRDWDLNGHEVRRGGVSAFGFGGTNFHTVLEEYIPGKITSEIEREEKTTVAVGNIPSQKTEARNPIQGAMVIGGATDAEVTNRLKSVLIDAENGKTPKISAPQQSDLDADVRLAIDYKDAAELADKSARALKAFESGQERRWKALQGKGIFLGKGPKPKVAFIYPGQGSQYVNMLKSLNDTEKIVANTFRESDATMTPLLGKPLTDYIFVNDNDEAIKKAEEDLKQTEITQPAVLTSDIALTRMLDSFGMKPDMVMGHSLGEYGALVASGILDFGHALKAVSARGTEMSKISVDDNGLMAAILGPLDEIRNVVEKIDGYVVIANINSNKQAVIGGETKAVNAAVKAFQEKGINAQLIPVSHAFHTKIIASASGPLGRVLAGMDMQPPKVPIISNVTGEFYPQGGKEIVPDIIDLLSRQVASPVQFVKGLKTLHNDGARVFVEVGPKRALTGFAEDVLGGKDGDILSLSTNHPKNGDIVSLNRALCGLYSCGHGVGLPEEKQDVQPIQNQHTISQPAQPVAAFQQPAAQAKPNPAQTPPEKGNNLNNPGINVPLSGDRYQQLGHLFAEFMEKGMSIYGGEQPAATVENVCITGAALGLPGTERVFDDSNIERLLNGEQFIKPISNKLRQEIADKNITRLVKTGGGGPRFETIDDPADVIKLAAKPNIIDLVDDFGFPEERMQALDEVTVLAIGAGLDAMRDAGIPLKMKYKNTTTGTKLPDRWLLPEHMRDETGVIFASAFPGYDSFADEMKRFYKYRQRTKMIAELKSLRDKLAGTNGNGTIEEIDLRIQEFEDKVHNEPYNFDRRFLFKVLSMGHSQFAEYIGARGPNTQVNSACASTTLAITTATDWIQAGRCKRVIVISADDITTDSLLGWFGAGFLATGAAATDAVVENAAIPFDRRRHGMIIGMGGAALVLEAQSAVNQRGMQPIADVLSTTIANSAFHGTRLDVDHIKGIMEGLINQAEKKWGVDRFQIAPQTVFVSHETYTPARGGSAAAEVNALRHVFGPTADQIVIANTKGLTGHAMGTGIEDVLAIKAIETGIVPPIANFKEVDPELGQLNLSKGGKYPVHYALRLAAGFGSQISMSLTRWRPTPDGQQRPPHELGYTYRITDHNIWNNWMAQISESAHPELEVVKRTLRVKDNGAGAMPIPEAAVATPLPKVEPAPLQVPDVQPVSPQKDEPQQEDAVQKKVLQLIAEKTGYPPDMLDPDLDLEADLGIDTVKQAEMFASVREEYNIERDDSVQLRDYSTLASVIQFVYDKRPELKQETVISGVPAVEQEQTTATQQPTDQSGNAVQEKVLQLIAEKTGYPPDMLDLDLDLEADLGIDTVKQAEMFASVREEYNIERDDSVQLRDYSTLASVIQFVFDKRPELKQSEAAISAPSPVAAPVTAPVTQAVSSGTNAVQERVLDLISEKTGYPKDMLDLDLDLEADLGIDTVKQAEMFASVREEYSIERQEDMQLREYNTLNAVIQFVYDFRPDLKQETSAPAPVETPVQAEPVPETQSANGDAVQEKVLDLISEKTGYPKDMLDLDLDLEADLGIDTVKQAEMFASVREEYSIERQEDMQLREYNTLNAVIQFVYDFRPDLKSGGAAIQKTENVETKEEKTTASTAPAIAGSLDAANQIPRRMPVPVLRPAIELCKESAIKLNKGSRVIVMPDNGGVAKSLLSKLKKLGVESLLIEGTPTADELINQIEKWQKEGDIKGVYWLSALDHAGEIKDMDIEAWHRAINIRVKLLYTTMRTLFDQIAGKETFLVSATRLGGQHGYDDAGAYAPLGGAVSGFTKSFKREKPDAHVKVVDFEKGRKTSIYADQIIAETLFDPGAVEIGYKNNQRWTVGLQEKIVEDPNGGMELNKKSVFVVTGAAGSITSAITADLAQASGGIFYLLDLAPKPDPTNPDIIKFNNDKEGLKRDIFQRLKESGQRATPAMVDKELAGLERSNSALSAIQAVENAGGKAFYYSLNLMDNEAVAKVIQEVEKTYGRIDVLLHAGGLEISRSLADKEAKEYDLVFDVKSDGWFNLLSAIGEMPLSAAIVFSSIAGRFGNAGQTDYSAANDLLCKSISSFRSTKPETRGIAFDWTAWGGIGMAVRGSIPTIMKAAGIDMLPPEAGIPMIRRELTSGNNRGEFLVAQSLGIMMQEFDESGGLDLAKAQKPALNGIMTGKVSGLGLYSGLEIETSFNPKEQPFLFDHQINGTPVLPGVMGIEAMTEAAKYLFPDWHVTSVENVSFMSPFKFYKNEERTVKVNAQLTMQGNKIIADCSLSGSRKLHGQDAEQITKHFSARIILDKTANKSQKIKAPAKAGKKKVIAEDIYKLYFHGPAYQVIEQSWLTKDNIVGSFKSMLPANHSPKQKVSIAMPRLIELCFQTAGIFEMGKQERMGLPYQIKQLNFYAPIGENKKKLNAVINEGENGNFDAKVVDSSGTVYLSLEGYRTMQMPDAIDADLLKPLKEIM
ncbi:MAG: SDR family NAD(P)-dependent oxidoreductase [Calditrichaeota bacterium]|nr:SDR family NAD(P)-dependent oxidoreductase [Calditrichota bacterium]NOG44788.1 SDR family NAD(P)-dependent oxidoreductase [Calditrichota bacterium]